MLCGWNYFQPRFREKNRELQRADSMKHLAVKFTNHKCFCPRQLKKTFCTLLQPNCKLMANGKGEQGSAEIEIVTEAWPSLKLAHSGTQLSLFYVQATFCWALYLCVYSCVCVFQVWPGAEPVSGRGTKRKEPEGEAGSRQRLNDRRGFQPSPADSGKLL